MNVEGVGDYSSGPMEGVNDQEKPWVLELCPHDLMHGMPLCMLVVKPLMVCYPVRTTGSVGREGRA